MNTTIIGHGKNVLALIPARGGSKGLPRKNILPVGGQPLIAWTINAAKNSNVIDKLVLSSEDHEIIEIAKSWGCEVPFKRPNELAGDEAKSIDVVLHALQELPGYEYLILLQPTSPLRLASDIDAAFSLMFERGATSCVSVCEASQSPYLMYKLQENDGLTSLLNPIFDIDRRQDLPPVYTLNGAIYIARVDQFLISKSFINQNTVAYKMPIERSIDIDRPEDFEVFRGQVEAKGKKIGGNGGAY
jgi:N-acylneuraminate cytidylyltransferase